MSKFSLSKKINNNDNNNDIIKEQQEEQIVEVLLSLKNYKVTNNSSKKELYLSFIIFFVDQVSVLNITKYDSNYFINNDNINGKNILEEIPLYPKILYEQLLEIPLLSFSTLDYIDRLQYEYINSIKNFSFENFKMYKIDSNNNKSNKLIVEEYRKFIIINGKYLFKNIQNGYSISNMLKRLIYN